MNIIFIVFKDMTTILIFEYRNLFFYIMHNLVVHADAMDGAVYLWEDRFGKEGLDFLISLTRRRGEGVLNTVNLMS